MINIILNLIIFVDEHESEMTWAHGITTVGTLTCEWTAQDLDDCEVSNNSEMMMRE